MSYIIAFVAFAPHHTAEFPVNCHRTDIAVGDAVVVRMASKGGTLQWGVVRSLHFLNWPCRNEIAALASEASFSPDGIVLNADAQGHAGFSTAAATGRALERRDWVRRRPRNRAYTAAHSKVGHIETCTILFRLNGVDTHIYESTGEAISRWSPVSYSRSEGRFYENSLIRSRINLFERTIEFAEVFANWERYEHLLVSVGQDTSTLPVDVRARNRGFGSDLYTVLGGSGGPVYVGDGMSLTASGRWLSD